MHALLVVTMSLSALLGAGAPNKPTLAVLDLEDKGAGTTIAQNLTDVVASSLAALGVFEVLSRANIEQMVRFEQDRQLLGCSNDASCLAELGGALGVALMVTGSIGKVGDTYLLNLALTDAQQGRVRSREQRQVENADELAAQTDKAVRFLVRELLEGQRGEVILKTSESGAEVEIDGHLVGTTPLARQTLAGGPHRIRVSKKGFVTASRDIELEKGQPLVLETALVPSLEFIADYDATAGRWRMLAYVSGSVGAVALGFGLVSYLVYNANRADEYNREVAAAGCSADSTTPPTSDCQARFADLRDSIRTRDTVSVIAMLGGAAALGAGWYFYREGPAPGRYDPYKPGEGLEVSLGVAPTSGGLFAGATLRYD